MIESFEFDFSAGIERFRSSNAKNIKRPREFAYYSLDQNHKTLPLSIQSLRYSYPCMSSAPYEFGDLPTQAAEDVNQISLRQGFTSFNKHDDSVDEHLDAILDTLEAFEIKSGTKVEPDVLMFRGMMTKVRASEGDLSFV